MNWTPPPGTYGAADPLFLLLLALAVEAYVGDRAVTRRWIDPRPRLARVVVALAQRLNRPERAVRARQVRGLLVLLLLSTAAALAGLLVSLVARHYPFGWVLEFLLLTGLLTQRGSYRRAQALRRALEGGSLVQAREALRPLAASLLPDARIDGLTRLEVAHIGLAGLADRFVAALVAPVFWYVLLGLPALFAVQTVQVLAQPYRRHAPIADDESSARFAAGADAYGWAAVLAERVLLWLPDRLAAAFITVAALIAPNASAATGLRTLARDKVCAWSAFAGSLRLALNDAGSLGQSLGQHPLDPLLRDAASLYLVACLVQAGSLVLLVLIRQSQ